VAKLDSSIPTHPSYRKPLDVKMGSGKGNPEFFVAKVKPGTILFEMQGVLKRLLGSHETGAHKLPIKTRFIIVRMHKMKISDIRKIQRLN